MVLPINGTTFNLIGVGKQLAQRILLRRGVWTITDQLSNFTETALRVVTMFHLNFSRLQDCKSNLESKDKYYTI